MSLSIAFLRSGEKIVKKLKNLSKISEKLYLNMWHGIFLYVWNDMGCEPLKFRNWEGLMVAMDLLANVLKEQRASGDENESKAQ